MTVTTPGNPRGEFHQARLWSGKSQNPPRRAGAFEFHQARLWSSKGWHGGNIPRISC